MYRISLIVLDIVERCSLPQDIRVSRDGIIIYSGSVTRIPKELLNEKVLNIHTSAYGDYIYIGIE